MTFVLSYRLGDSGGWRRTIAGPALLAVTTEVVNPGFNPLLLMVTLGPWAAGKFVRSRRRLAAELAEAARLLEAERSRYAAEAVRYVGAIVGRARCDLSVNHGHRRQERLDYLGLSTVPTAHPPDEAESRQFVQVPR